MGEALGAPADAILTKDQVLDRWPPRAEMHPPLLPDDTVHPDAKVFMVSRTEENQIVFAINSAYFEANTGRPLPPGSETTVIDLPSPQ